MRRRNVEEDLDYDDEEDVKQALPGMPDVTMSKKKSRPSADNSHNAARCADKLGRPDNFYERKQDNAGGGAESRDQIASGEPDRADCFFQWRTEHVESKEIEQEMHRAEMKEKRCEKPPKLALVNDCVEIKCSQTMQRDLIV